MDKHQNVSLTTTHRHCLSSEDQPNLPQNIMLSLVESVCKYAMAWKGQLNGRESL